MKMDDTSASLLATPPADDPGAGAGAGAGVKQGESLLAMPEDSQTPQGQGQDGQAQQGQAPAGQVPVEYEALTLPEGVSMNEETQGEIKTLGKELGLTQQQLQRVVDYGVKKGIFGGNDLDEIRLKVMEEQRREAEADPELKGNLNYARRAVHRFGGAPVVELLDRFAISNNPVMLKFLVNVGKAVADAPFISGPAPAAKQESELSAIAKSIYGSTTSTANK